MLGATEGNAKKTFGCNVGQSHSIAMILKLDQDVALPYFVPSYVWWFMSKAAWHLWLNVPLLITLIQFTF